MANGHAQSKGIIQARKQGEQTYGNGWLAHVEVHIATKSLMARHNKPRGAALSTCVYQGVVADYSRVKHDAGKHEPTRACVRDIVGDVCV